MNWPTPEQVKDLSDHQREKYSVIQRSNSNLAILNGGPGTGKTYTAAAIVKALPAGCDVGLAAPTGKAAIRMMQLMREQGVNREAKTIHRLLGVTKAGYEDGNWGFRHNAGTPLPHHVLILDEISMLSTDLAARLFSAVRPGSLVMLIGDTGQLLPVSHGAPLRDLLSAGVPCAQLDEIRRTSGDMAFACQAMAQSGEFRPSTGRDLDAGQNWWHMDSRNASKTRDIIASLIANLPDRYTIDDVQVLCTINKKSQLGRESLNEMLAPLFNPQRVSLLKSSKAWYAPGDRIMCLENGMYQMVVKDPEEADPFSIACDQYQTVKAESFVANGEIGTVLNCKPGLCDIEFDNACVRISGKQMQKLTLAYAITVHKSQGSQWPIVIFPIDDHKSAQWMACRELLYTAVSRQQKLTITIGQAGLAKRALQKVAIGQRKTFLAEDLAYVNQEGKD